MAEAADAEDGDEVAGARSAVAQAVEGGDAGAEQRGGVDVGEVVGHEGEGVGGSDHVVGIAAVVADAGDVLVFAEDEVAATTGRAVVAVAAVPAEADALAGLEERHVGADGVDDAGDFVAGDARVCDAGQEADLGERVAVADAAGLHADADVAGAGIGEFALNQFKGSARSGDLDGTARYRRHACFSLPMDESAQGKMHEEINNAREV